MASSNTCQRGVVSLLLLGAVALIAAAPIEVPAGNVAVDGVAKYDTLYPNDAITESMCRYDNIGKANAVGVHSIKVPGDDQNMFIELVNGGHPLLNDGKVSVLVDIADPSKWKTVETEENLVFCGQGFTSDGKIVLAGGHINQTISVSVPGVGKQDVSYTEGLTGVRVFDKADTSVTRSTTMASNRWKPTLTLLPDGKIMITGGVAGANLRAKGVDIIEVLDPANPTQAPLPQFAADPAWMEGYSGKPFFPFVWVLPTGHVLMYSDTASCIFNPSTGECLKEAGKLVSPPARPGGYSSQFPFSGSAVMTTLKPDDNNEVNEVEIVVFGGSNKADHPNFEDSGWNNFTADAVASHESTRIKISFTRTGPDAPYAFTFGEWQTEDMGYPRVMPDATLLPNGDVVLTNGAQTGVAGFPKGQDPVHTFPAFWATLYQTDKQGERYTLLCGTEIVRTYHATTTLTTNGTLLIAGTDRPDFLPDAGVPWFNGTGNAAPQYDMEILQTPYSLDEDNKPSIVSLDKEEVAYGADFTINYEAATAGNEMNVTSVVLVAPSAVSTSWNQNQRVVQLLVKTTAAGSVTVTAPSTPFIAPPQWYMVFINNGKTYSSAKWIKLTDTDKLGAVAPKP